jgi:hypothetical protein
MKTYTSTQVKQLKSELKYLFELLDYPDNQSSLDFSISLQVESLIGKLREVTDKVNDMITVNARLEVSLHDQLDTAGYMLLSNGDNKQYQKAKQFIDKMA